MALRVLDDLEQGSDEWLAARRGMVTASVVGQLVTHKTMTAFDYDCPDCGADALGPCFSKAKGKEGPIKTFHPARINTAREDDTPPPLEVANNDVSRNLTNLLVAERITGWTEDTYQNADMFRGVICEPIARDIYSGHYQQAVEVGFMVREEDGWKLGYSPDGLVGMDGLVEIKSPRAKTHLATILAGEVPAFYMPQLQAGLLVSGRDWIDFVSYVGGMPLFVKRVLPDPRWFEAITAACVQFETTAAEMVAAYEQKTEHLPVTERVDLSLEVI